MPSHARSISLVFSDLATTPPNNIKRVAPYRLPIATILSMCSLTIFIKYLHLDFSEEADRFISLPLAIPTPLSLIISAEPLQQTFYNTHPVGYDSLSDISRQT